MVSINQCEDKTLESSKMRMRREIENDLHLCLGAISHESPNQAGKRSHSPRRKGREDETREGKGGERRVKINDDGNVLMC